MKRTEDILAKLLLQNNDDWEIENVTCDDSAEEIHISLKYRHTTIKVEGKKVPILNFRHERSWKHLDMWQYKTILDGQIPRYRDGGQVKSVPVPWGLPNSRLSFEQVHGVMLRAVERGLKKRDKSRVYRHICMDEKSIRRGHEYVSMLYDGETGHVIEVEAGRTTKSVDNLFAKVLQRNNAMQLRQFVLICGTRSSMEQRSISRMPVIAATFITASLI